MNSMTRPFPGCCPWRCRPCPVTGWRHLVVRREVQTVCRERSLMQRVWAARPAGGTVLWGQPLHTARALCMEHKVNTGVQDCLRLLGVAEDCSDQQLKEAYLEKAKAFHPDSSSPTADPHMFSQIKEAYKAVLEHRKGRELMEEEEEDADIIFDIKHTAPQHRQYLEFEGDYMKELGVEVLAEPVPQHH